jgi:ADP-ribose pyrophosphatase YjhB (NUDIX family)
VPKRSDGSVLVHRGFDSKKNEFFHRPLGGGVEFGETAEVAVRREFLEELAAEVRVGKRMGVFENIFIFEGKPGHEIVFIFEAEFADPALYLREKMDIIEGGKKVGDAIWVHPDRIRASGEKLYPEGIAELL